ncbi:MAG: hypothetical protein M1825_000929 [Sarcosagium campestre]|nr:MAG: hypothetical protein M1825_000929 [Sarcosagium campestre]
MPFIPHTPEGLLARSDSKNPARTCSGITSTGIPCRRAVAASREQSPLSKSTLLFCWQHSSQAEDPAVSQQATWRKNQRVETRSSIDTLADRLGLLNARTSDGHAIKPGHKRKNRQGHQRLDEHTDEPISLLSLLCCIGPVSRSTNSKSEMGQSRPVRPIPAKSAVQMQETSYASTAPIEHAAALRPPRPVLPRAPSSRTSDLLALIPKHLPAQTVSSLLAELAKPLSDQDQDGYIYIFWLTDEKSQMAPPSEQLASELLSPPTPLPSPSSSPRRAPPPARSQGRHIDKHLQMPTRDSDSMHHGNGGTKTILLKIGRASNVQRRMNEWSRQCGYNLSLVRYYPYIPSSSRTPSPQSTPVRHNGRLPSATPARQQSPPSTTPRKVPYAHRVERLIHLELADSRVKNRCDVCGKEHREWFSVGASRAQVRAVDEVVRRWVAWAEAVRT